MAIKFETNIPVVLRFPYGDHKEVNGQYGQQFMYTVESAGLRDRLYATPGLHYKLQDASVKAGSVMSITKIEVEGNRKDWRVEAQGLNGHQAPATKPLNGNGSAANGHQETPATNGHLGDQAPDAEEGMPAPATSEFEQLQQTMRRCLSASYGAWERLEVELPYSSEDVRAVGITLFLECSRKGIAPVAVVEEGVPF